LRRLRDAGLLARKGRGSATYYVPTELLGAAEEGLSSNPQTLLSKPEGLLSNPNALLSNPPEPETTFDEAYRRELLNDLPGELAASVGAIGHRHPPEEVRVLVVALCRLRPWRTEELSHLLRRRPETIRQHYLRPLMRDGRLAMTNPNEPNDPQQAYRAAMQDSQ